MRKQILNILVCVLLITVSSAGQQLPGFTGYVNPFIGTGGHGHTYPGASVPFGMVQLSPDTRLEAWDGCSAYHFSDSIIYGFSHTHLSGTGCSDYGDILFMPVTGETSLKDYNYASSFSRNTETARPGFYSVILDKYHIRAELTATSRVGFHRYTFPGSDQAGIVVDLQHRDKVVESGMRVVADDEIEGFRISQSWAEKQMVFFTAKFSKPFLEKKGDKNHSVFIFSVKEGEKVLVKVGISGVSMEGARKNLEAEIPGWNFDSVCGQASNAWNAELGKIRIEGATLDQRQIFYTALYHTMLQPNLYSDGDGQYRGRDLKVHTTDGFNYYTVFSLWDTYRAANPLYTIIEPQKTRDFVRTFLLQYDEGGMLPVWELSGNETGCMIGYHSVSVIADAFLKGIKDFDTLKALEAMKHSAMQDRFGLKYFNEKGYIPSDKESESVSRTLEYAYDDWCIAMMAKSMGKEEDYKTFIRRAQNFKNIFDPSTGFMRAKSNETWFSPFDPSEVNFNYTEANAWQYTFYVPQDLEGLTELMGGHDRFTEKLDALFSADSKTTGREQADISGMIGQYAHGNEPSHHMAYLYNYGLKPWKTQEIVHKICKEFYKNTPDGLIGNEDCGQMSAWYIFSAMGFYPVAPCSGIYVFGSPLFPKVSISLENKRTFTLISKFASDTNIYIQSAVLNGKPYFKSYISHDDIIRGGELIFTMGPQPNKAWGNRPDAAPPSRINDYFITPVPSVEIGEKTFFDFTYVSLANPIAGTNIFYTLNGSDPDVKSQPYTVPFKFEKTTTLKAIASQAGLSHSFPIEAHFQKIIKNRKITLNTKYSGQYAAGGDIALIDLLRGGENFRTGGWQGYEGTDLEAIVDLGKAQTVHRISLGCIQDQGAWIFMPLEVNYFCSTDGVNYHSAGTVVNKVDEREKEVIIKELCLNLKNEKTRYIKVVAKNRGLCPAWHPGSGHKSWIFADEITIE